MAPCVYIHEEDGNDKEVSIALKVQGLYERVAWFIVIERPCIAQIGSIEVIEQVAID